ncbi:LysR family transcriptional regulator [Motiliproteus sp. MSK22-1]|uniref:LysR family transcriptional regulator n=1 Tax=Motiliproteus sp. MSK22-1 TaxID=1897630 RepID=UPI0009781856|nr:LysR family transcriptional regulator [Motiliproteus sp. MSK22-1]OMH36162.1 hypothetical protein BGP75_10450 [Motiliproteus sp. MSK22-1]
MHLHQLRYFVAIVETGSVTKAAQKCYVSQPSISQQMAKLEDSVGHKFFNRAGRKQELTEAGKLMYQQARQIIESVDSTKKLMSDVRDSAHGKISIGINPTIGPCVLPTLLLRLSDRYPAAMIEVREGVSEVLQSACARDELDIVITASPKIEASLESEVLMEDRFYIAINSDHPLASKDTVVLADLATEPFILLDDIHCLARQIEHFCFDQEFIPKILFQASHVITVKQLLMTNYGVTILPGLVRDENYDKNISYFSLDTDEAKREIILIKKPDRYINQVTEEFMAITREYCGQLMVNQRAG